MTGGLKNGAEGSNGFAEKIESRGDNVENVGAPAGFGQKFKRHCARFWWLHLIIFCAGVLIIALCLVYVGMPRIAQSLVNKSSLKFYELQFLNPTPNSVTLNQTAQLHNPSTFTPTLDPFTAGLFLLTNGIYSASQFTSIDFPTIHALHPNTNVTTVNQVLDITDMDILTDYCIQVISNENVTTALVGETKLHEGALPVTNIKYNSSTTYAALNGLKGFNTVDLKLNLTAKGSQPNLMGTALVPNPSVMTVELGNVTLELSTSKGVVGMATINDLTIRPGNNSYAMTATVDEAKIISAEDAKTGLVTMYIIGNSSTYNGQRIPYYEKALSSNNLTLSLNVTEVLANSGV